MRRALIALALAAFSVAAWPATFTVTNTNVNGAGSLKEAMTSANAAPASTIAFNIAGGSPFSIDASELPAMTVPVTIDGTTQPGYAGTPLIKLTLPSNCGISCAQTCPGAPASVLNLSGGSSVVRGITLAPVDKVGITLGGNNNVVDRITMTGNVGQLCPSFANAIDVVSNTGTQITNSDIAYGNSVVISGGGSNVVRGNSRLYGEQRGLLIGSNDNIIGGSGAGEANQNIAAARVGDSLTIVGDRNIVQGNRIGNATLVADSVGVGVVGNSNSIGGGTVAAGNDIEYCGKCVLIRSGTSNGIHRNKITKITTTSPSFTAAGIVLDAGANHDQAAPTLISATSDGSSTTVTGTLASPAGSYTLEFFINGTRAEPQRPVVPTGETFLGTGNVTVPPSGTGSFSATLPAGVSAGTLITATATSAIDDTSPFAAMVTASASGCPTTTINLQPASQSINQGGSAMLSVGATGSGLTYQWYTGTAPNTASPISSATSSTISVSPSVTTSYWVRVSSGCGSPAVDSDTATITVNPATCPSVTLIGPANALVTQGQSTTLSVSASGGSGFTYQWYEGTRNDTSNPVSGGTTASLLVSPSATTHYWVKVTNSCGNSTNSDTATVAVCQPAHITRQPVDQSAVAGAPVTLSLDVDGSSVTVTWYRGSLLDVSAPIGNGASVTFNAPSVTTKYWARVTNSCGGVDSRNVIVTVGSVVKRRAVKH